MISAALAANVPPKPAVRKPGFKHESEASRDKRMEHEDSEGSLSPSTFKEARWSCALCGTRSMTPVHELCEQRKNNGGPTRSER